MADYNFVACRLFCLVVKMTDKIRAEFDAFAKEKGWDVSHNGEHYNHVYAYYAWIGWQASRAALFVELPPKHEVAYGAYDSAELRYALDSAGVAYK